MGKDPACSVCRATPVDCWQCLVRRRNDKGRVMWHYVCNILTGELLHSSADAPKSPVIWPIVRRSIDFYPDPLAYRWDSDTCSYQLRAGADPENSKHFFLDEDGDGI